MIKLLIFIPIWLTFMLIKLLTAILGLFVVPFLYSYRHVEYEYLPNWTRPWSNPEDWAGGIFDYVHSLPTWWTREKGTGKWSFYKYHAIRNPANGLRSFKFLALHIVPEEVKYIGTDIAKGYTIGDIRFGDMKPAWYLCWQGNKAGFKFVMSWNRSRHLVIKIGWRVEPVNSLGNINVAHKEGAGFASKFLVYRKG